MPIIPSRRSRAAALVTGLALPTLAACGADVESSGAKGAPTATITSCGVEQEVRRPSEPVAYDISAIEKMFALGLADEMRGIALPATVAKVAKTSPYKDDYAATDVIGKDVLGQEQVVGAEADWVFAGWQAGFSPERGITPDSLTKLGIGSYIQQETCFNYDDGKVKGEKVADGERYALESTYADLDNLGAIFDVEDRADTVVADLKKREKALDDKPTRSSEPTVFVYDSGTTDPYTSGRRTAPHDIIDLAGGRNLADGLDARWDVIGWEAVTRAEPDVILVVDYGETSFKEKAKYLRTQSPIKDSPAVENDRIRVLDYGEAVSGPRNLDAAEDLSDYLDEEGL